MTNHPDRADKDLISRAAVVKMLHEKAKSYSPSMFSTEGECYIAKVIAMEALQEVADMPHVDVKHGRWIFDENANDCIGGYVCSECRVKNDNLPCVDAMNPMMFVGSSFCPNCGVKMVEEKKQS